MTKKSIYISTPIYYPSGDLHIGSVYTTIACDVLAKYKRLMNYDVFFQTGLDEHGQKIQQKASELRIDNQLYVDMMAEKTQSLWKSLNISNDYFVRTTNSFHKNLVENIFERLIVSGDIYLGKYYGWYSLQDEEFFTENQLIKVFRDETGNIIGGIAPSGHPVSWLSEECYFLKLSKYKDNLIDFYNKNPNFIQPKERYNEIFNNFIKNGINDLAVSRTSINWGINVKSNPKHVIYVWIDALINYISSLQYNGSSTKFNKFWTNGEVIHVIGKDILRFHAIYWPILLMMLNLKLPDKLIVHDWIVLKDGKMSKSKGNVIYPDQLINRYGIDCLKYYLLKNLIQNNDLIFTPENFITTINSDLSNDLGNLLNRTIAMINKYNNGQLITTNSSYSSELSEFIVYNVNEYHRYINKFDYHNALKSIWKIIARTNKYIDENTPWILARENKFEDLNNVLINLVASLRLISYLLNPFLEYSSNAILNQLGLKFQGTFKNLKFDELPNVINVTSNPFQIFPRLDSDKEIDYIKKLIENR